jgi:hypothetical protein
MSRSDGAAYQHDVGGEKGKDAVKDPLAIKRFANKPVYTGLDQAREAIQPVEKIGVPAAIRTRDLQLRRNKVSLICEVPKHF